MIARRALLAAGFAAAFSGGLAGCAGVRLEPLDVRLVDLALVQGGGLLEQRLALTLALSNPNPTDVALDGGPVREQLVVTGDQIAAVADTVASPLGPTAVADRTTFAPAPVPVALTPVVAV